MKTLEAPYSLTAALAARTASHLAEHVEAHRANVNIVLDGGELTQEQLDAEVIASQIMGIGPDEFMADVEIARNARITESELENYDAKRAALMKEQADAAADVKRLEGELRAARGRRATAESKGSIMLQVRSQHEAVMRANARLFADTSALEAVKLDGPAMDLDAILRDANNRSGPR